MLGFFLITYRLFIYIGAKLFTVYKAFHNPTGKFYIGYTSQELQCRIGQHWALTPKKRKTFHHFLHSTLMSDWAWEVLQVVETYKEARDCEMFHIKATNAYDAGLNERTGAKDLETRKRASERMKAYRAANPEPWHKGRTGVFSDETRHLMRLAKLRNPSKHVWTEEELLARSLAAKNKKSITELKSGLTFHSISAAAKHFGVRRETVRDAAKHGRLCTGGLVFVYA